MSPRIAIVAAVARGGVIGARGTIPWHIPEDLAHFKSLTLGHSVVMGRVTWDSLPSRFRPLPGRRNIVVTRNREWAAEGAEAVSSLNEALALCSNDERIFVIGGAALYETALPLADELYLTEIDLDVEGDRFFPPWPRDEFDEMGREEHATADGLRFEFVTYARTNRAGA